MMEHMPWPHPRLALSLWAVGVALLAACTTAPERAGKTPPSGGAPQVRPAPQLPTQEGRPTPSAKPRAAVPQGPGDAAQATEGDGLGDDDEAGPAEAASTHRGLASWYGKRFHGRKTASGELFSMHSMTAAHRTLPLPSFVRVRHVANGRQVVVRVNDRGPFHGKRIIDLSRSAARHLGMLGSGQAEVVLEVLNTEDVRRGDWLAGGADQPYMKDAGGSTHIPNGARLRAYTSAARGYWVELAALRQLDDAESLHRRVNVDMRALAPLLAIYKASDRYRVQLGPYATRDQADRVAQAAQRVLKLSPSLVERR